MGLKMVKMIKTIREDSALVLGVLSYGAWPIVAFTIWALLRFGLGL